MCRILGVLHILIARIKLGLWLSARSDLKIHHSLVRFWKVEGGKNKSQLEINPPTYKPTNTDTIWVGVREALVGKTKGHELSAEGFSAWNISFLFTNTFSFEDLIKWVRLRSTGTQQNNKSSVVRPRVKQHAAK